MDWQHPTKYRHYIQKFPQGNTSFEKIDLEEAFKCRFQKLTNAVQTDVKNIYTEDFAEHSGVKVFTPPVSDLAYNASEIVLCLRWRTEECGDVIYWSDKFFDYITGQKFQYNDTLTPNRYWQLIMEKAPSIETKLPNGDPRYLIMKYTLRNWAGKFFTESQL